MVYLLVYQHVPVARCVELIADLTGGTGPSTGFVHGMLTRCATAVRETVNLIKTLVTLAHVVGFDETTLRAGPAGLKRYVLSAVTEFYSVFHLGGRDLPSFRDFAILPGFAGIAVHDRYQNYYNTEWKHLGGHQACCSHYADLRIMPTWQRTLTVCPAQAGGGGDRLGIIRAVWRVPRPSHRDLGGGGEGNWPRGRRDRSLGPPAR